MYTNADQLPNKMSELELLINQENYDVIAITEVLPKRNDHHIQSFVLEGYSCLSNTKGRGVSLFIKEGIEVTRITEIEDIFTPSVFCKMSLSKEYSIILGLVYRSPSCSDEENTKLNSMIDQSLRKFGKEKYVLLGDFNYPEIDWISETCTRREDHPAHKFFDTIQQHFLHQLVKEPTHHRAMQTPTTIDLVITNEEDLIDNIHYLPPLGKSHHSVLAYEINCEISKQVSTTVKFLVDKGDYDKMREFVREIDWNQLLTSEKNVDEYWREIQNVINTAKEKYIPTKKIGTNNKRRTFAAPQTLLDKIREKRRAFKMFKKYPTTENHNRYARARNQVKWESRKAEKARETKLAKDAKANPKSFFSYVARKTKPKEAVSSLRTESGQVLQTDKEKAEELNRFFASVFTQEPAGTPPNFNTRTKEVVNWVSITEEQMGKALKKLNHAKSPGPDDLHPKILKELAEELAKPLTILFNKSISESKIPTEWKQAEVRPIFKKGDKACAGNYRPVSLTSVVCKIFEGFIRDELYNHIIRSNLLCQDQYGFTKGRSCTTQLLVTIHEWMTELDKDNPVDAIYLDLRKAFDTVPHKRLLHKLEGYGIKGHLLNWIHDFLSNRTQYVSVNGNCSDEIRVTSGVPQGSVLGPTLFIYYINDMPDGIDCDMKIFADDTKVYSKITNDDDYRKLQESLRKLVQWTEDWLVKFNCDKCKVLHMGRQNPKHEYRMTEEQDGNVLQTTEGEKDLGVTVDPELTFDQHISEKVKKANSISGLLMRTITYKTKEIMVPLFKALVRPILEYANAVWNPYLRKHIDLIEGVQRRFTKKMIGMENLEYEDRLKRLHLPSLEYRRTRGDMIEVYKIMHEYYDPSTTSTLFSCPTNDYTSTNNPETQSNPSMSTRGHDYKLTKHRRNKRNFQESFTNRTINLWNNLPKEAVYAKSLNSFKNQLDKSLKIYIFTTNFGEPKPK